MKKLLRFVGIALLFAVQSAQAQLWGNQNPYYCWTDLVSLPCFNWQNDVGTGIYSPFAGAVGITSVGREQARFAQGTVGGPELLIGNTTLLNATGYAGVRVGSVTGGFLDLMIGSTRVGTVYSGAGGLNVSAVGGTLAMTFGTGNPGNWNVNSAGQLFPNGDGSVGVPAYTFAGAPNTGIFRNGGDLVFSRLGTETGRFTQGGNSTQELLIGTTSPVNAAGFNGFRANGSTGGFFDVMANGTRQGTLFADVNGMTLQTVNGAPVNQLNFGVASTTHWRINSNGYFVAPTDNTYDIGATGATRPRSGYFGTSVVIGTDPGGTAALRIGGDIQIKGGSNSVMAIRPSSGATGRVDFQDNSGGTRAVLGVSEAVSAFDFYTGSTLTEQLRITDTPSSTRYITITGSNGGNPTLSTSAGALTIGTTAIQLTGFTFTNIGTTLTANGMIGYCSDCTIANPCAGAGTGALAKRLNGVNVCN